jgi:UDP-glucose 4-epimerase
MTCIAENSFNPLRSTSVLIIGGMGFIGSNLARRLLDLDCKVTLIDSLIPEYGGNPANIAGIQNRVQVNISDVRDVFSLPRLVQGQDFIFNLAGQTSHMDSMQNPQTDLAINCSAQLSFLEICREHNPAAHIVFASTRQIYGKPRYLPVDEKHPLDPVDVNGINKLAGERYHTLYARVYGLKTSVLRLTNTIGPRMRIKDARQTFLGVWVANLLQDKPIEVWGGGQLRDLNYVEDVVDALMLAVVKDETQGRIFNLGCREIIDLKTLADKLIAANNGCGCRELREFPAERKAIDIGDYYGDYSLFRDTTGWEPRWSLDNALKATLDYYRTRLPDYL